MATEETEGREPTLVMQDDSGNYYMVPMKHMHLNAVGTERFEDLDRRLESLTEARDVGAIRAVGVYEISRDERRTFVEPKADPIVVIPSPPS